MKRSLCLSFLIICLLAGCAIFVPRDIPREELLLEHLQSWQAFRMDGIIEINIGQIRLRKNIQLLKTDESFSITLFDSGIFGLRPSPFLNIAVDSTMTLSLPADIQELTDELPPESDLLTIEKIKALFNTIEERKTEIVRDGNLVLNSTEFLFNENMQFELIRLKEEDLEVQIRFHYRRDQLNSIVLHLQDDLFFEILVDRIIYE